MTYGPNVVYAWNTLTGAGMSQCGAAGIIGNFLAESLRPGSNPADIDPGIRQIGGGPGRGIAQWSAGVRWDQCVSWCKRLGYDPQSVRGQVAYAIWEMKDFGIWNALCQENNVNDAAAYVMNRYEMPASRDATGRQAFARSVYEQLHNANVSPYVLHRLLQVGLTGDDVARLQRAIGVTSDGVFGPITKSAVIAWQSRHGLSIDGIVGPNTARSLGWRYA